MSSGKKLKRRKSRRRGEGAPASRSGPPTSGLACGGGSAEKTAAVEVPAELMQFLESEDVYPAKRKSSSTSSLVASPSKLGRRAGDFQKTDRLLTFELVSIFICCRRYFACRCKYLPFPLRPFGGSHFSIGTTYSQRIPFLQLSNFLICFAHVALKVCFLNMFASTFLIFTRMLFGSICVAAAA
jgi:hypothetical protein